VLRRDRSGRGLCAGVAVVAALVFAAPASAATVRHVDANALADVGDCSVTACKTISYAISNPATVDGDVIQVAAGTYHEGNAAVTVNKRLSIEGAQAGVDARGRSNGAETILDDTGGGFQVTVSGVSIDGFTIQNAAGAPGVFLGSSASGYRVVNNIFLDNTPDLSLNSDGIAQTVIRHNAFENDVPANSANAISSDDSAGNVSIDANSFTGHGGRSMHFFPTRVTDLSITGNTLTNDAPMDLRNVHSGAITGNTISGTGGDGVTLSGGDVDLTVSGNSVSGSTGSGLALTNGSGSANQLVSVVGNDLSGNTGAGLSVGSGAYSGTFAAHLNRLVGNTGPGFSNGTATQADVRNNWWGCNGGPGGSCNGSSGPGNFTPWLVFGVTAERGRILTGGDTDRITAGFGFNSNAQVVDASDFPPTPVAFSNPQLGTLSLTNATTSGGLADTLFTSGSTAGTGSVTGTADGQQQTASFEVSSQAGPQGLPGTNGTNGTNGQDGATGPQGPVGPQGPAGPEGPAGPSTPSSPAQPNPVLILSNSLRATKNRIVSVSINCPLAAGLCDGRLGIGVGNLTLGNTAFLVNGGNRAVIRLRGGAGVIRTAIKKKKVTVVVLSRDNAGTAALTTKVVKFRK
jgi:Right handed beta helix region/Collagen triple helix repeat (20 copies)